MTVENSRESIGFMGYRYHQAKHLLLPVMPDGKPSQLIDGKNLIFDQFTLKTFPGTKKLFDTQLGSAGYRRITGVFPFVTATGAVHFVLCTPRDVYKFTPGDTTPTSIKGELSLTATEIDYCDAVYWTDTTSSYEPRLLITNGIDTPFYWTGTGNAVAASNVPICKYLSSFSNHILAMHAKSGATFYQQRDQRSNVDSMSDWSGGTAGSNDLRQGPGALMGDMIFGDVRWVFKEDSIALCRSTGSDPPLAYNENYIPIGTVAARTLVRPYRYDVGFFLGSDLNAYLLSRDGSYLPVGDDIVERIRAYPNDNVIKYAHAFYYPKGDMILLAIPTVDTNYCRVMFAFDLGHYMRTKQAVWSPPIELGVYVSAGESGKFRHFYTLADLAGHSISQLSGQVGSFYSDAALSQVVFGDQDGYVYTFDDELATFDGVDITWEAELPDYRLAETTGDAFRLQEYELRCRNAAGSASLEVSTDGGKTWSDSASISMTGSGATDEDIEGRAWPDIYGKKHRVKLTGTGKTVLLGQRFFGTLEGRR